MAGNFKFVGFEPANELKTLAKQIYWLVEEKSPSQAAKTGLLTKVHEGFQARFKISSSSGIFEAEACGDNAQLCLEELYGKMKSVLKAWSSSRVSKQEIA